MESNESFSIAVKRGAAIVQIAVTSPVVINTTRTQPGTSPRSSFNFAKNESCALINALRNWSSVRTARSAIDFIIPPVNFWLNFFSVREFCLILKLPISLDSADVDK